jgi:hypothetical protein
MSLLEHLGKENNSKHHIGKTMPEMKIYYEGNSAILSLEIRSYMLFPNDDTLRHQYLAASFAKVLCRLGDDDEVTLTTEVLRELIGAPSWGDLKVLSSKSTKRGVISGEILLSLIEMDNSNARPSVRKGKFLAEKYFHDAEDANGKKSASSEKSVSKAWSDYRDVSHFWAAQHLTIKTFGHKGAEKYLESGENLLFLAAVATRLLERVLEIDPGRNNSSGILIDAKKVWTVPKEIELPSIGLLFGDLNEDQIEDLGNYTLEKTHGLQQPEVSDP